MILCSGCFDGLHAGHVAYLQAADRLRMPTEQLMVVVAPDAYIRASKGREPYWPQPERCDTVRAVRIVDEVWYDNHLTPAEVIEKKQPRVFVKGSDWAGKLPPDVIAACRNAGTLIVYVDTPGRHTAEAMA
jgi:cytidyltransferase-like protein